MFKPTKEKLDEFLAVLEACKLDFYPVALKCEDCRKSIEVEVDVVGNFPRKLAVMEAWDYEQDTAVRVWLESEDFLDFDFLVSEKSHSELYTWLLRKIEQVYADEEQRQPKRFNSFIDQLKKEVENVSAK